MIKKYANDQAVEELVRRHMLPRVQNDQRVRGRLRGRDPQGDIMELLVQTAKRGRVPRDREMELNRVERKYQGVDDQRLLNKARQGGGLGQRGTRMMRRLIKRQEQQGEPTKEASDLSAATIRTQGGRPTVPADVVGHNALLSKRKDEESTHPLSDLEEDKLTQLIDTTDDQSKKHYHNTLQEFTGQGLPGFEGQ